MIEVQNLTKRYRDRVVVNDLSFAVQKGEVIGFLGPNGAGKTTTMRILTGYMPATAGTARVAGFDVFEQPLEVKRRIGYLPENPPVYVDMTVRAYLAFCAGLKRLPRAEVKREIERVAHLARVEDVAGRIIGNLSKGYRQRVGLAQALLGDPEVLILDEPTVGLDPLQIREVRELVKTLAGRHTVILSTHILPEVAMTCQKVLVIHEGRLVDYDTLDGLIAKHLPGRRVTLDDIAFLEEIYGKLVSPAAARFRGEAGGIGGAAPDVKDGEAGGPMCAEGVAAGSAPEPSSKKETAS
jgi:ABC-2 type transport system ATP-binding protein